MSEKRKDYGHNPNAPLPRDAAKPTTGSGRRAPRPGNNPVAPRPKTPKR